MEYDTISKYLFIDKTKTVSRDPRWFFKRSTYAVTGWLTKTNRWIQGSLYHCHPFCIHEMEPDLEPGYSESQDVKILTLQKQNTPKSRRALDNLFSLQCLKAYECIHRGNVRVLEIGRTVIFTANCLDRINSSLIFLQRAFPDRLQNKQFGISDIIDVNGKLTCVAEYCEEENKFKIEWNKRF
jgi:hypothetical protein